MKLKAMSLMASAVVALSVITPVSRAADDAANDATAAMKSLVDPAIEPLMERHHVPGMAVGVIANGKTYVFDYGVASAETRKPVTQRTLFEIGSISKTFTATLAAYAQLNGQLNLSDNTQHYLPSLRGSAFGKVSLLSLGTHTPGGLPLQVPDSIHDNGQLLQYFLAWKPTYAPGTYRTYANPGIGTLGLITAKSMGQDFASLIEQRMFPALGMTSSGDMITQDALVAIHWTHRTFAFVVIAYLVWFALKLRRFESLRRPANGVLLVVLIQFVTGLSNIVLQWPLPIAVAHNGGAAVLLLLLVMLNFRIAYSRPGRAVLPARDAAPA